MARLATRLTERLGITHPILSAPMALAGGGALAAAVTRAGGLGLIGGGYGDADWLEQQFTAAGNTQVGCGFITWSMARKPELLTQALAHEPSALMLSFADPRPFAAEIAAAGVPLICQCQTLDHVRQAFEAGAAIIVAQGTEAGGHGASRATLPFVPEAADLIARESPATLLLAAGGIADGRGLAAALMLGADGVLIGTRFWASREALVHERHHAAAVAATGDGTVRSSLPDIARQLDWPKPFDIRVANNAFIAAWAGREQDLKAAIAAEAPAYREAFTAGDPEKAAVIFGEAAGLIADIPSAGEIVERMVSEAVAQLDGARRFLA
ncbi:MAG: nitronate monooxygenase [Bosea sp.]|uniref:NAD(P)H-dependent flavin oxidoreductase n=1 Tax=unclassified Bosea (in: a-proteobacteria) TaxID=2653178 RepID=UPI00096079A0|nr:MULTISPECIES: nitronate monooxygenase [unclassified Bosea (in: a-proteobacteria)]MBN9456861.1 nitronate monooxygenase [Bosea sp. (in: a-proteobacteria)]OJV09059.1 MAG: oxidoreductase [Bosea sp. 67-29]